MRHAPGRPAGADNFVKWRRTIDEHLELGRLTWDEYGMFSWLCTKADQRTGRIRTSWPTLADQTTLSANYAGKLCRSLKGKGYIAFREHRGRRGGLVEVAIDKFPLLDGTYTALQPPRRRGQAEVPPGASLELLSELFGHERGAFTSAVVRKVGLLAVANAGTLFLDEIGELPPEAQAMLLRFLQEGEVRPVGSTETARVNVRLIAATHRDLEAMKAQGSFREDLYYRLRRVVLEVPPLRARREDIPLLVEHIRRGVNQRYGLAVEGIARPALLALEHAPWPGNVRELEAVVEQAMIFRGSGWVSQEDLDLPAPALGRDAAGRADVTIGEPLSWCQEEALTIAGRGSGVRRRDLMARCRISREAARRHLTSLAARGLLRRVGQGRSTRYVPVSAE